MKVYEAPELERVAVEVVNALLTSGITDGGEICISDGTPGGDIVDAGDLFNAQRIQIFK